MKRILLAAALMVVGSGSLVSAGFPGQNGPIAFSKDGSVYVAGKDGSGVTSIADGVNPAWSPTGETIAYSCDGQICVVDMDDLENPRMVTLSALRSRQPSWSPDGSHIVFARQDPTNGGRNRNDLFSVAADGSDETSLDVPGNDPAWSPDGSRIIFTQGFQGDGIYSVRPDGSDFETLFAPNAYIHSPTWSPDGTRIAFTYQHSNFWRIWVMRSDGSNPHEVFRGKGQKREDGEGATVKEVRGSGLAWSPDGRRLLYVNIIKDALCKIDLRGQRRGCLVPGQYPDWKAEPPAP